ncbi:MAG: cytochrome c-type biogenesis CcmF C-terminal domain-containing protein, partial [Longimicrobiales bacterium]
FYGLLAFAFAAFALTANVQEYVRGTAARRRAQGGGWLRAFNGLINANPRRYGGYFAHIGLIVAAIGITASTVFRAERQATLSVGESVTMQEYTVRFDGMRTAQEPQRFVVGAHTTIFVDGEEVGTLFPRLNFYQMSAEPIATPAVRTRPDNDLYLTLLAFDEQDGSTATLSVIVEPLVGWIWVGGIMVTLGALFGIWPRKRAAPSAPGTKTRAAGVA